VTSTGYRDVLALPGVRAITVFAFLARIPATAAPFALTLHVVLGLDRGYGAAGLLGAGSTVGVALGAPLLGRLVDARGLFPMLAVSAAATVAFWAVAPVLPYRWLLAAAFVGGVLGLPVYSLVKQILTALVPAPRRRAALALDSMSIDLSYVLGPAAGTLLAVQVSPTAALWSVGGGLALACAVLWVLAPPTRVAVAAEPACVSTGPAAPPAPPRAGIPARLRTPDWLDRPMAAALLASGGAVGVLFGSELAIIASLQATGQARWIAVVNAVWCLASVAGGYVHGAMSRRLPLPLLVGGLGLATTVVAFGGAWWTYALLLVPAGALCAPSLTESADVVGRLAPEQVRGVVTGLQTSAMTVGSAAATPLCGVVVDAASPAAAIVVIGVAGMLVAAASALLDTGRAG